MVKDSGNTAPRLELIGTEETWATPEYLDAFLGVIANSTSKVHRYARLFLERPAVRTALTDVDLKIADMDSAGIDVFLLSIVAPGVQVFGPDEGTALAQRINDSLFAQIQQHPSRFAGLATVAPQNPHGAAKEVDRAISQLGLNGIIINSHTNGEFLDDPKFWPIFEACIRNDAALYLHPWSPCEEMIGPYEKYQLFGAMSGLAAECSLHALRMILGGVFDEFPALRVVLGHGGEGLPYWLYRLDDIHGLLNSMNAPGLPKLERHPSEYIRSNFYITTSGMFWDPVLEFCVKVMGADHVMFAIDSPFASSQVAADFMRNAPLSDTDKALIASGNARRIFRIHAGATGVQAAQKRRV
jgi:5-carboxyvanillate decarboxylase